MNIQVFDNITFSDLWPTKDEFIKSYDESGLPKTNYVSDEDLTLVWTLLSGRFADSTIKAYNTHGAFKIRFMSRVWQHAPSWIKELEIQTKLRSLSLEDGSSIYEGSRAIYNNALNPGTAPSTSDSEELNFINSQNTTKYKKSKLEGLSILDSLIKKDVTERFLRRFDDLFKTIIYTGRTKLFATEIEGEEL